MSLRFVQTAEGVADELDEFALSAANPSAMLAMTDSKESLI